MEKDRDSIFITIIFLELLLLLVLTFSYINKVNEIKVKDKKIEECSYEIKRLKLIEQDFEEAKPYLYECYKEIENKAERSGK